MNEAITVNIVTKNGDIWSLSAFCTPENNAYVRVYPEWAQGLGLDDAVYCARHLEQGYEHHCQDITLTFNAPQNAQGNNNKATLAFAAVLADLALRGRLRHKAQQHWLMGEYPIWVSDKLSRSGDYSLAFRCLEANAQTEDALWIAKSSDTIQDMVSLRLREQTYHVGQLAALLGHGELGPQTKTKRVYFPVVDSNSHKGASLQWVEVSTRAVEGVSVNRVVSTHDNHPVNRKRVRKIPKILTELQALDHDQQAWDTRVRFSEENFSGASYELALAMAYRIARGFEPDWTGKRLVASGCSSNWASGEVCSVDGREQKLDLLRSQLTQDDRLLLPANWSDSPISGVSCGYLSGLNQWGY